MSEWPSVKARRVLAALLRLGWAVKREASSHRVLARDGWPDTVFAFHDGDEIGPRMLARIGKRTGLRPEDLWPPDAPTHGAAVPERVTLRTGRIACIVPSHHVTRDGARSVPQILSTPLVVHGPAHRGMAS